MNRDIRAGLALLLIGGFLFILALTTRPDPSAFGNDDAYDILRTLGLLAVGIGVIAMVTGLMRKD